VTTEGESYLLWGRGAGGVVRCRRESEKEGHSSKREDQSPRVEQCVYVTSSLAEDRAESGLQGTFLYLTEGEAVRQVLDGGRIRVGVGGPRFMKILKSACYQDHETYVSLHRLAFESRVTDSVVVDEDVDCHKKGGACLPVRELRGGVFRWLGAETSGNPS